MTCLAAERPRAAFASVSRRARRTAFFLLAALALVLGQHASLRHELGHAFQRVASPAQPQHPASDTCEKCFAFSAFAGGLPSVFTWAPPGAGPLLRNDSFVEISPAARTVVAVRSRAPPALS